jgi:uncharacterized small protein (DUF1192 family)
MDDVTYVDSSLLDQNQTIADIELARRMLNIQRQAWSNSAMTDEELQVIRARYEAATPGPWRVEHGRYSGADWLIGSLGTGYFDNGMHFVHITTNRVRASELYGNASVDAEFIAHAREDIPALLAEVERLRAELAKGGEIWLSSENAKLRAEVERLRAEADKPCLCCREGGCVDGCACSRKPGAVSHIYTE